MSNASILIKNITPNPLSIDVVFQPNRPIRALLGPQGTFKSNGLPADQIDVGAIVSLSQLQTNPQVQQLLNWVDPTSKLLSPKITIQVVRGTADIPGADVGAVIDATGMDSSSPRLFVHIPAGGAGARDVPLYLANFPFAADLTDAQIMVKTAAAGTVALFDQAAGAGNQLTTAMSTAAAARVRDAGTGQTAGNGVVPALAKNSSLYAHLTAGTAELWMIIEFARVS